MATTSSYYGANYTVVDNTPAVASFVAATEWGGNVKAITDTFTAGATDTGTAGSVIYVGKLPKNSIPLACVISSPAAMSWSGTIGWSGDVDALGDFTTFTAAGSKITGPAATVAASPTTQDQDVYITTADAAIVSSDSITTTVLYVQGG